MQTVIALAHKWITSILDLSSSNNHSENNSIFNFYRNETANNEKCLEVARQTTYLREQVNKWKMWKKCQRLKVLTFLILGHSCTLRRAFFSLLINNLINIRGLYNQPNKHRIYAKVLILQSETISLNTRSLIDAKRHLLWLIKLYRWFQSRIDNTKWYFKTNVTTIRVQCPLCARE